MQRDVTRTVVILCDRFGETINQHPVTSQTDRKSEKAENIKEAV
jgi:hypothetical protein